ncbi:hypothetical protein [Peribacillus loiseleuriae]|uniref:hypothetical protein n=1 Tax=Peribacillus loiseleuriae TaxID=1679170 RepID=UPI003D082D0A
MIFIQTNEEGLLVTVHHQPFHEKWGYKKTENELLEIGYLVESIPEFEEVEGKESVIKYINGVFFVEYKERELTVEEQLQQAQSDLGTLLLESANDKARIAELEVTQGEMLMEIAMLKMGGSL